MNATDGSRPVVVLTGGDELKWRHELVDGEGDEYLRRLLLRDLESGEDYWVEAGGLFVLIGSDPSTEWLEGTLARDRWGFVVTGPDLERRDVAPPWRLERPPMLLETSMPGVFAAGDVRRGSVKRVASAVGEGAVVVQLVHRYLEGQAQPSGRI